VWAVRPQLAAVLPKAPKSKSGATPRQHLRPRSAAVVSSVPLCLRPSGFGETSDLTKYTSRPNTRPLPLTLLFGTRGLAQGVSSVHTGSFHSFSSTLLECIPSIKIESL
jgi:hypothetical protein